MSWGHELWDQFENLSHHTSKGIDFCDKYAHFLRDRCMIEVRYAGDLKRLVSSYLPKKKKEEENPFSYTRGFICMLKELHDIASQHEVIAENTQATIQKDTQSLVSELRSERRKHLQDCGKLQQLQSNSLQQLERSKKNYERAFRDAEKAHDAYKRADLDQNLSRAEVDKHSKVAASKGQDCVSLQKDYASQLQTTNKYQQEYYTVLLPDLYSSLQKMDERRVNKIQECILESANIERNAIPIINTCIDEIVEAANKISASFDSQIVIDKYKSGFHIPNDIPFEDLSNGPVNDNHTTTTLRTTPSDHRKEKSATLSGQKSKKRAGIFGIFGKGGDEPKEDFSDLQPAQRKKKLQQKIDQITKEVSKEVLEREGMLKMRAVYNDNTALGDPSSLDGKIEENSQKLDKLNQELMKFDTYLAEAEGRLQRRHSASDDNVSQSPSEGSVNQSQNNFASAPGTPVQQHYEPIIDDPIETTFIDEEFSVIGTCRALYFFQATNEGSLDIGENEELSIIEQDQGDGWTRVRNSQNQEGFVPTSYVECHFYDADQV